MGIKKCVLCGEPIFDNDIVPFKNRFAHNRCFNASVKAVAINKTDKIKQAKKEKKENSNTKSKPKAELKDALTEEEYKEKKQFYDYLNNTLNVTNSAKIYTLVEKYQTQYNCTFKVMYQTLVYLNEIAEINLEGDVIGLIPYYYDKAKDWFEKIELIKQRSQNINVGEMYKQKNIQISQQPKRKNKTVIDISSI